MVLVASSARNIMSERYSSFKEIWNHCNRTAFYARKIAMQYGYGKIAEHAFLAGLLHDLGKIVLLSTSTKLAEWISDFTRNREMRTSTVIEEIAIGMSHSTVGARIAEKWNLPHYVIESVKHHHSPLNADIAFREIVAVTYLANLICGIETGKYDYTVLEEDVLSMFGIQSEAELAELHDNVRNQYESHNEVVLSAS